MRNRLILLPGWGLGTASLEPLAASLRAQDSRLQVELVPLPELADSDVLAWVDHLDRKLPTDVWLGAGHWAACSPAYWRTSAATIAAGC